MKQIHEAVQALDSDRIHFKGRTVIKKLCVMDIFRILGSGSLLVTAMLAFSGKANTSIPGLGENDTARADSVKTISLHHHIVGGDLKIRKALTPFSTITVNLPT